MGLLQVHQKLVTKALNTRPEKRSAKEHFKEEIEEFIEAENLEELVLEAGDVIFTMLRVANEKARDFGVKDSITLEHIVRHSVDKLSKPRAPKA